MNLPRPRLAASACVLVAAIGVFGSPALVGASNAPPAPLSAAKLRRLVVAPAAPFAHVPDTELQSGLMEIGNPRAGTIGTPLGTTAKLRAAGFQRGWESIYRTPARDVVNTDVFQFRSARGAKKRADAVRTLIAPGYSLFDVPTVAGALGASGTSPEGRAVTMIAFSNGRFAVLIIVGGQQPGFDYQQLATDLATRQLQAVKSVTAK